MGPMLEPQSADHPKDERLFVRLERPLEPPSGRPLGAPQWWRPHSAGSMDEKGQ